MSSVPSQWLAEGPWSLSESVHSKSSHGVVYGPTTAMIAMMMMMMAPAAPSGLRETKPDRAVNGLNVRWRPSATASCCVVIA